MATSQRSIFRDRAVQHYFRKRQKDVLPRLVALPVFVLLWMALGILLIALVVLLPELLRLFGG